MAWGDVTLVRRVPFDAGYRGRIAGLEVHDNPLPLGSNDWEAWRRGWTYADDAIRSTVQAHRDHLKAKGLTVHRP